MRLLFLLFFLDSLSYNLALNTFEFVRNDLEPTSEFSSAILANNPLIKLPEQFILCSSHFQSNINSNTRTIYVLYQDENMTIPWINIGFWGDKHLWANIMNHGSWYNLGSLRSQDLFKWTHICIEIDLVKETMSASINGNKFGVINVSGINPSVDLILSIRLGIVHNSLTRSKFQFFGKITNIQLLRPIIDDIANLTKSLCINRASASILSWSDMKWNISGNKLNKLDIDDNLICPISSYADVAIPFQWTKSKAIDMCNKLGNGKITTSFTDTIIDNECYGYWSPYVYSADEGLVRNENDNAKLAEELPWMPGMYPVNITGWSNIVLHPEKGFFENLDGRANREECLICNTSLDTEYTLRGNCKYSFLGNFNYKTNIFNKYIGFLAEKVTIG